MGNRCVGGQKLLHTFYIHGVHHELWPTDAYSEGLVTNHASGV